MKLPSRLSLALGTLVTGLIALSLEVQMSHPLHVASGLVGAVVLFLIHPGEAGVAAPAPAPPWTLPVSQLTRQQVNQLAAQQAHGPVADNVKQQSLP